MSEYIVASIDELEEGERIVTQLEGREICIFNIDGDYYAYTNWCAHQAGPVCEGNITGTMEACFDEEMLDIQLSYEKENRILNCPWHGWEYDIISGECLSRKKVRLPQYPVTVKDENIVVSL